MGAASLVVETDLNPGKNESPNRSPGGCSRAGSASRWSSRLRGQHTEQEGAGALR